MKTKELSDTEGDHQFGDEERGIDAVSRDLTESVPESAIAEVCSFTHSVQVLGLLPQSLSFDAQGSSKPTVSKTSYSVDSYLSKEKSNPARLQFRVNPAFHVCVNYR